MKSRATQEYVQFEVHSLLLKSQQHWLSAASTKQAKPSLLLAPRPPLIMLLNIANLYNFVTQILFWRSWPPLAEGLRKKDVMDELCTRDIK